MKSLANEFFQTMAAGTTQHHAEHVADYDLIVNGIKNETDLTEQVGLVEQMVAEDVQAIVIAPADSKALVPRPSSGQKTPESWSSTSTTNSTPTRSGRRGVAGAVCRAGQPGRGA